MENYPRIPMTLIWRECPECHRTWYQRLYYPHADARRDKTEAMLQDGGIACLDCLPIDP